MCVCVCIICVTNTHSDRLRSLSLSFYWNPRLPVLTRIYKHSLSPSLTLSFTILLIYSFFLTFAHTKLNQAFTLIVFSALLFLLLFYFFSLVYSFSNFNIKFRALNATPKWLGSRWNKCAFTHMRLHVNVCTCSFILNGWRRKKDRNLLDKESQDYLTVD